MKQPIGVTLATVPGQSSTPVYEDANGADVFETDAPYLLTDGKSLMPPMPVVDVGSAQPGALAVSGLDLS